VRGLGFNGGSFFQFDSLVGFAVDNRSASSIVHGSSGTYGVWLM